METLLVLESLHKKFLMMRDIYQKTQGENYAAMATAMHFAAEIVEDKIKKLVKKAGQV